MKADKKQSQKVLSWAFASLQGGRDENQDFYGSCKTADGSFLFVVCDGMGGLRGGSTASKEAVRVILEEAANSTENDPELLLMDALQKANAAIYRLGRSKEGLRGMGTTVVALLINDEKATTAHVGDSRIYQLRGRNKVFRTFDHSMVFELVKRGRLTEEQARLSADSNVISRALGMKPEVEVEINANLPYLKGDRFMLCTDGISGALEERKLIRMIVSDEAVDKTVEELAKEIDHTGIENGGGHDNLTAALIEININSKIKPPMSKKSKLIIFILSLLLLVSIGLNICFLFFADVLPTKNREKTETVINNNYNI